MNIPRPKGRLLRRFLVLFVIVTATRDVSLGQAEVRAALSADRGAPLIGEPIHLTLTVEAPADANVTMPPFPLDWPPFMVTGVSSIQVSENAGRKTYRQEIIAILWQPGDYETPALLIEYTLPGTSEVFRAAVEAAFFTVPSVLDRNDLTLRPLKPPLALAYVPLWLLLAGAAGLLAAAWRMWQWLRRRRADVTAPPAAENAAHRTLRELQRAASLPPLDAYPLIGDMLRRYVEERSSVSAEEMTTDELLAALHLRSQFTEQHRRELRRILERVDLVKFAQYQPEADSTRRLVLAAARWVESAAQEDQAA